MHSFHHDGREGATHLIAKDRARRNAPPMRTHFAKCVLMPSRPAVSGRRGGDHARNRAPSFLPRIRLLPRMVTVRKAIAHTPSAEATYLPVPMSWKSS